MWKNFVKEYFTFTRKERIGIYSLLGIIFVCLLVPFSFPFFIHQDKYDHGEFDKDVSELKIREAAEAKTKTGSTLSSPYKNSYKSRPGSFEKVQGELFYFDPNTITFSEWRRLGIREKTASTIQKYVSRGGHFYKAEDLGKIWGLHKDEIERLLPYVRIAEKNHSNAYYPTTHSDNKTFKPFRKVEQQPFDVNNADSAMLDSLPGIGPRLAKRILAFREKLGGFISVDQVKETYALPDSTFLKIRPKLFIGSSEVKKIDINVCTIDQLKTHPYIRYQIANAIIQYRTQHGAYNSLADLKNIMIVTNEVYAKISPYLKIK